MENEPFKQMSVTYNFNNPSDLSALIDEQNAKGWHLHLMSGIMTGIGDLSSDLYSCCLVFRGNEHSLTINEEKKQRKDAEEKKNFGFLNDL